MPYTPPFDFETVQTPFTGSSQQSKHTSFLGAQDASSRAANQCIRLLEMYAKHGSLTDAEMETLTGIQRSSVIPRRRELQHRGLVQEIGSRKNPASGITNTTYGLSK